MDKKKQKELELKEFIDSDFDFISGNEPKFNNKTEVGSTSTTDKVVNTMDKGYSMTNPMGYTGIGYMLEEENEFSHENFEEMQKDNTNVTDEDKDVKLIKFETIHENMFQKQDFYENDLQNEVDLPSIYKIKNKTLVNYFYSIVKILNSDKTDIEDKVGIFSELIQNVDFSDIGADYKKALIKKLKNSF